MAEHTPTEHGEELKADGTQKAEDGIRDVERSRGLGDVYKRQAACHKIFKRIAIWSKRTIVNAVFCLLCLSLIHI